MFDRVADATGITGLHTPVQAPKTNANCERFVGSVRRECPDHLLIFGERHFHAVLTEYANYINHARPHQGLGQRIPSGMEHPSTAHGRVLWFPALGGLRYDYRLAAWDGSASQHNVNVVALAHAQLQNVFARSWAIRKLAPRRPVRHPHHGQ
jgi:Integrase core domain